MDLAHCFFGTGEGDAVYWSAEILRNSPALATLIVRRGELKAGVTKVLNALTALTAPKAVLRHFDFGANELGAECAVIVGAYWQTQVSTLRTFIIITDMDRNKLGDKVVRVLMTKRWQI